MQPARPRPIHFFLFAAYPVLALLAYNIEETPASAALRPLLASLTGAAGLLILLRVLLKDWLRAALACTLTLALFFSYGHLYDTLEITPVFGMMLGRHRLLFPAWLILLGLGWVWIGRTRRDLGAATRLLNLIAAFALIFPLAQIGLFEARSFQAARQPNRASAAALHLSPDRPAPDIYYLILDGYSRDDMLEKFYELDNKPFLDKLSSLGFTVTPCSQSNYAQTMLSLASSLNYDYLDALGEQYAAGNNSRAGLPELIQHSAARQALEGLGYRVIAFESGFEATQLEDADEYLSAGGFQGIDDFETLLVRTTAGRVLSEGIAFLNLKPDWEARDQAHRQRILFTLEALRRMPEEPGPKFVFAHLITPHWPHVFGPNGEPVHERPDSETAYRNQVIFLNGKIEPILKEILARSETPPIIIVQADHGAIIESPARRMSILNAYYLPGGGRELLYEGISPVNSFRVIFNDYFGANLPLLEDRAYYSRYEHPFDFQQVPEERPGCVPRE